jgi:hypothetical protein
MNQEQIENKNILFKPKPITCEEEVVETHLPQDLNNTASYLNRSSMMTYSKM